jgi:hypothetical protein
MIEMRDSGQSVGVDPERIERVRRAIESRARETHRSPKAGNWTYAFFERYAQLPLRERQARAAAYALVNEPVCLFPEERLVGALYQGCEGAQSVELDGSGFDPRWAEFSVAWHAQALVRDRKSVV